jgi:hypothetical protein
MLALDTPADRWLPELKDRRVLRRIDGPIDDTVPAECAITVRDVLVRVPRIVGRFRTSSLTPPSSMLAGRGRLRTSRRWWPTASTATANFLR